MAKNTSAAKRGWVWDEANGKLSVYVDGVEAGYFTTTGAYITVAGTGEVTFGSDATYPTTSDSNALGTTTYMWSDLFLASGGVVNFNAGDVTLTHSSGYLTVDGGEFCIKDGNGVIVGYTAQETISDGGGSTDVIPEFQMLGTTQVDSTMLLGQFNTTNTSAAMFAFVKGGNAAIGTHTAVADNEYLGRIVAFGDDATDIESAAAEIRFVVDGTVATGNMPGSIEFYTTPASSETLTLAFTINADQNIYIGNANGIVVGHTATETISDGGGSTDVIPEVQVLGTAQADSTLMVAQFSETNASAPMIALVKGGNAAIGSHTAVADNEYIGRIVGFGDDGTDLETPVAEIRFVVDDAGGVGGSQMGGSLEFYTTADGGTTLTNALTITSSQVCNFTGAINIATSGSPLSYTAGTPIMTVYATNAGTDGATNAQPVVFDSVMTGAGQVGGRVLVNMTTNVQLGGWANAFKAQTNCSANGGSSGTLSTICAEMVFPTGTDNGYYAILELEANCPSGWNGTTANNHPAYIYCNQSGAATANWDSYGLLFAINGYTAASTKFVYGNTVKCELLGTTMYLPFSSAEASFTTAYPIVSTSTIGVTVATDAITATCATINATTGRVAKFAGSIATGNLGDGYGAVEIDITATGNLAGMVSPLSSWLNITGTGVVGAANMVAAQTNGIYADSGANTSAIVIFGMRCSGILTDAPTVFAPFSLNTSNRAITALFEMNSNPDVGYQANSGTSGNKVGDVPLFCDAAGQQYFVRIYDARG